MNRQLSILLLLAVIFLFVYSSFYAKTGPQFTSPDETANYYFIKLFADKSSLTFQEPLNLDLNGLVHPRSMGVHGNNIVPGSFLGMIIIYGSLAKLFGDWSIIFLTPVFAVIGVLFFYLLIKKIFDSWTAFFSAILLLILPPFWYYSARGMFHNILFCSLLIIGIYFLFNFLVSDRLKKGTINAILPGFFLGLALLVRTSEIIWVSALVVVMLIICRKRIHWKSIFFILLPIFVIFIILFSLNHQIYGSVFSFAYDNNGISSGNAISNARSVGIFSKIISLLFPFNFNSFRIMAMADQYLVRALPFFSIIMITGIASFLGWLAKKAVKKVFPELNISVVALKPVQLIYWSLYLIITLWLIIYYGSYAFNEFHDIDLPVMGSSYFRYWLPAYIFGLPLIVYTFNKLVLFFNKRRWQIVLVIIFSLGIMYQSITWVIADKYYGLRQINNYVQSDKNRSVWVDKIVSRDSIIISGYADKVFFPERKVIVTMGNRPQNLDILTRISTATPIYYYYQPSDSANTWLKDFLNQKPFALKQVTEYSHPEAILYRLIRL